MGAYYVTFSPTDVILVARLALEKSFERDYQLLKLYFS